MRFLNYFVLILFSLVFASSVFAIAWPHQFYGDVTVNGVPANGASVVAKINGTEYGSTVSVDGKYGYTQPELFFVTDPNGTNGGETIEFFVNGTKVEQTATFMNNGSTELNLSLGVAPFCGDGACNGTETCSTCSADCGACSPPGDTGGSGPSPGGGGGGGGLQVTFSEKCIDQNVSVTVKLSNKKPAANATVKVLVDWDVVVEGKTNDDGIFVFSLSEAKEYKLDVRKPGYSAKKIDFSLVDCTIEEEIPIEEEDIKDEELVNSCENINCNDANPCTKESCVEGACNFEQLTGLSCGEKGTCQKGVCVEPEAKKVTPKTPSAPTGFFGLGELGGNIAVLLLIALIAGIAFFVWKNKKEE